MLGYFSPTNRLVGRLPGLYKMFISAEYNLSPRKTGEESSLNTKNKGNL